MEHSLSIRSNLALLTQPLKGVFQVALGSLFIALCAQISIPLPFTSVPVTGQTLAVLFVGATLGSKKGMLAVLLYLSEICLGFPFLAGGVIAPLALLGPRAGYLIGMVFQAYIAGFVVEKNPSKWLLVCGFLSACAVQLALGTIVLGYFVGWTQAIPMGLLPFIPGEILKTLAIVSSVRKNS